MSATSWSRRTTASGTGSTSRAGCGSWSEPGGICVTRAARDQLRDRVDTTFTTSASTTSRTSRVRSAPSGRLRPHAETETPEPATNWDGGDTQPPSRRTSRQDGRLHRARVLAVGAGERRRRGDTRSTSSATRRGSSPTLRRPGCAACSAVADTQVELAFWETVRGSDNPAMLRAYLEKYPDGEFGSLAEILLKELEAKPAG